MTTVYSYAHFKKSTSTSLLLILFAWFALANAPATSAQVAMAQCDAVSINKADALPNVMFNTDLPTFGKVCFLARRVPYPGDGGADPVMPGQQTIVFELWRDGAHVYTLPQPEGDIWPPACDSVLAVAFPRHGRYRDVVVIGHCLGAKDDLAQPLIFLGRSSGFDIDNKTSEDLFNVGTVKEVELKLEAQRRGIPIKPSCDCDH